MYKVCVLMSTYNGEKYLKEQIESILNQEEVDMQILIRDDGSSDATVEILKSYENQKNISYYIGENLKPAHSFIELLYNAPKADYYAFADQDDWWDNKKLYNAIRLMRDIKDSECIYFSSVEIVDKNLSYIGYLRKENPNTLPISFIDSPAIGCTMVINDLMREKIIKKDLNKIEIGMHDSWIYRVGLVTGANIIYDKNAYIKYRQHDNNVIGAKGNKGIINSFLSLIKKRKKINSYIARNLLKLYSDEIDNDNKRLLQKLSNLSDSNKIKYKVDLIFDKDYKSFNYKANIKFIYDIIMNRI